MPPITLYKGTAGLNNILTPESIASNAEEGLIEFSQAENISIDDHGMVSMRDGYTIVVAGEFNSIFCNNGDCFIVENLADSSTIFKVNTDLSFTTVVTGLTKDLLVEFKQVNTDTFWSNGEESGYIRSGTNHDWPVGTYSGPEVDTTFSTAPIVPNHMAFRRGGQCIISIDNIIYINHLPFQYGLYSLSKGIIVFESNVTMIAETTTGFFASDSNHTWFFRNTGSWYGYKQELAEQFPVKEWSLAHDRVLLKDVGFDIEGEAHVWRSSKGVCLGIDNGTVINITKEKVEGKVSQVNGACLLKDEVVISTVF